MNSTNIYKYELGIKPLVILICHLTFKTSGRVHAACSDIPEQDKALKHGYFSEYNFHAAKHFKIMTIMKYVFKN